MVEPRHFFPGRALKPTPSNYQGIGVLQGGSTKCRTSLLFQLAYNHAAMGCQVVLVRNSQAETDTPILPETFEGEVHVLERIAIKYIESSEELDAYIASSHLLQPTPHLLLVDDLTSWFLNASTGQTRNPDEWLSAINHTLSLLQSAASPPLLVPTAVFVSLSMPGDANTQRLLHLLCRHQAYFFFVEQKKADLHILHRLEAQPTNSTEPVEGLLFRFSRKDAVFELVDL
jgi:hypothetical protein